MSFQPQIAGINVVFTDTNFSECDNRGQGTCEGQFGSVVQDLPPESEANWIVSYDDSPTFYIACKCQ